jgi:hypothetical protein
MLESDDGELEFDLTKPAKDNYIIDHFTPLDRQYPFFRRAVKELSKMQEKGLFYKERVLAWGK